MIDFKKETNENYIRLRRILQRSGYKIDDHSVGEEEDAGHFWVMVDEYAYRIAYDASDEEFYRIIFPLGLGDETKAHAKIFDAINAANSTSKLAKSYIDDEGDLIIVLDVLASSAKAFASDFPRYILAMQAALSIFNKNVEG